MIDFNKLPLFLAPLAGYSDPPLRNVVKRFGCDVTVSEMISANALAYENEKTLKMLTHSHLEKPFIVQIEASNVDSVKNAVCVLNKFDDIDGIDLNCGCPAPKVVKQNAGSALLKDISLMQSLIQTIKKLSNKTYLSVKVRIGFDEKIPVIIAKACEEAGADFITMHGRTKTGGFSSRVDYEAIKEAKNSIKIPLVANGNIDENNANEILKTTQCDALMIGRASIGKPWIFHEIKTGKNIDNKLKKEIILYHFEQMLEHFSERGVGLFRKHLHEYSKGLDGASNFRNDVNFTNNSKDMQKLIMEFF
ncbi:dihydrouridine synthase (Dus) superfamily protein [Campylobacter sputorum subsp. bubulus]|uniref:tRNA-dihydrouridine synthase n=1 Tax=Campylobacter sputorum subsp. sputorum TaxID=32024 RepID=A0A381DJT4_9BACT|nr:tRNA-dihydrouridine synthase [Campylobacter sputorum]ASM34282.1 tRNA-dihydrouridine synthase B [Campylobacter sputorum aubsp. sputorum RM3237]KAB0582324.1 tRNA-dihydrouridine synthase [Campylobacter sputorum subsp. sputorum]QEL04473.1 tRNA-dihydrouridine synthase B [Campylobacter sputorum subsp. sputorum]SUX09247.1 dihydrouridine synthase (Dus) superfamily protein [Campylobacter sputorum subsp. bubulus]SUX10938.1 dihydrouridine synthase (Dus) superfamily protein [Campylobacter sputorum subs